MSQLQQSAFCRSLLFLDISSIASSIFPTSPEPPTMPRNKEETAGADQKALAVPSAPSALRRYTALNLSIAALQPAQFPGFPARAVPSATPWVSDARVFGRFKTSAKDVTSWWVFLAAAFTSLFRLCNCLSGPGKQASSRTLEANQITEGSITESPPSL